MSRVDDLVAELCPRGVPMTPLWRLTTWDKRFHAVDRDKQPAVEKYQYLLAKDLTPLIVDGGDVKILTTSESDLWTTEEAVGGPIYDAEVIAIPWGGNAIVQHYHGKFITSDNRIAIGNDSSVLDMKYLYYFIQAHIDTLSSFYRGAGIKHPNMARVLNWRIPVPPLVVQREIVRVLDQFTQLEAELERELEARRRQYEYYSQTLLAPPNVVLTAPLSDLLIEIIDHRGKTPKKLGGDWTAEGHRVVSAINFKSDRIDDNDHHYISDAIFTKWMKVPLRPGDVLLTSEAPLGSVAIIDHAVDWAIGQRVFGLRPDPALLNSRYLFHLLRAGAPRAELLTRSTGSTVSGIRQAELVKVPVSLPTLAEQQRVADLLDKFAALASDLQIGLPAELAARRKQFEYYRGKLLTFPEAAS